MKWMGNDVVEELFIWETHNINEYGNFFRFFGLCWHDPRHLFFGLVRTFLFRFTQTQSTGIPFFRLSAFSFGLRGSGPFFFLGLYSTWHLWLLLTRDFEEHGRDGSSGRWYTKFVWRTDECLTNPITRRIEEADYESKPLQLAMTMRQTISQVKEPVYGYAHGLVISLGGSSWARKTRESCLMDGSSWRIS